MGTDLVQIGNHKIRFGERKFKEIAIEICNKLNETKLVNAEYLRLYALCWERSVRAIRTIKTKTDWTYENDDNEDQDDCSNDFNGPYNLTIYFTKYYIYFFNPTIRYRQWINGEEPEDIIFRNEWRKYMYQIVTAFDGDRVIYLADNSHPLDGYSDRDCPFEEIETALKERFGETKTSFKELAEKPDDSYMIDYLKDIDWEMNIVLDGYYPEPNDLTSIEYDLNDFTNKTQLEEVGWDDETLKFKEIEGDVHFYHLARYSGVIVKHKGALGGEETIETLLDEYAPFSFDALKEKIEAEYSADMKKCYSINFYNRKDYKVWKEALSEFEQKLIWTGNGTCGGDFYSKEKCGSSFYVVNEKLAIELLLQLGEKYTVVAPIEIVREEVIEGEDIYLNTTVYKR